MSVADQKREEAAALRREAEAYRATASTAEFASCFERLRDRALRFERRAIELEYQASCWDRAVEIGGWRGVLYWLCKG